MQMHPSYFAAFRGGEPPHPVHPNSKAFHVQYVQVAVDEPPVLGPLWYVSFTRESREIVFALSAGSSPPQLWYRLVDFVKLVEHAKDPRYSAIAAEVLEAHRAICFAQTAARGRCAGGHAGCEAPPSFADTVTTTCFMCGLFACTHPKCSIEMDYLSYGEQRICASCQEDLRK